MFDFLRLVVGTVALFVLPGYALLALARRQLNLDWVEAFCMALGLSLVAVPLLLYATTLMGLVQGPGIVFGLLALCLPLIGWDWWSGGRSPSVTPSLRRSIVASENWVYLALALVFLFTLVARLWSIRGIEYPFWTDAYGHAVITQLVVDQGGVPTTYAPYAPIDDFTYHFGLHALAAWFHWITGLSVLQSMLIVGQILNVLVVPTTYIFAQRFFNSRVAGLVAALVVGLLSHMPAQFVNWGRYTQLDGQIILPVAAVLYLAALQTTSQATSQASGKGAGERAAIPYRLLLLTVIVFAGLFFAHYRIFIFGMFLVSILWAWAMVQPSAGQSHGRLLLETTLLVTLGLLLLAPWLWRLAMGFGGSYAGVVVSGYQEELHGYYYGFDPKELLEFGMFGYLWILAGAGALWGLWQRNKMVIVMLLWQLAVFGAANLHLLNFTPLYSNTIVIIALYLPLAALIGYLFQQLIGVITSKFVIHKGVRIGLVSASLLALVLLGINAVVGNTRLVAEDNVFVRDADIEAMHWVEQEIPEDALFYIAAIFWTPTVAHGLDGGYYLPLLAARQTIMPPQHYASDGTMELRNLVNQRLKDLVAAQAVMAEDVAPLYATLNNYGISHIYIGARKTQLDPGAFLAHPDLFVPLYNQAGVWIFQVQPVAQ
jgi:hypothetical protein